MYSQLTENQNWVTKTANGKTFLLFFKAVSLLLPELACCGRDEKLDFTYFTRGRVSFGAFAESVYVASLFRTPRLLHLHMAPQALLKETDHCCA